MSETSLQLAKTIISDCLMVPLAMIGPDDSIEKLGQVDSLVFEMICGEVEISTGCDVDIISLAKVDTVQDLANVIEEYKYLVRNIS